MPLKTLISLLLGLLNAGTVPTAAASSNSFGHPWKILQEHRQTILHLSSDDEALQFYNQFIPAEKTRHVSGRHQQSSKDKHTPHHVPDKIQTAITTFGAALATAGYVQEFRTGASSPSERHGATGPTEPQLQWLLSKPSLIEFQNLMNFHKKLSERSIPTSLTVHPPGPRVSKFSMFLEQWLSTDFDPTGIALFQKEGFKGIHSQLQKDWQTSENQTNAHPTNALQQSYFQDSVETRLLPLLRTHFLRQAMQMEARAYDIALESWHQIQHWQQREQSRQTMKRLCGTWKWIIHNHQNHGDIKTTMTFASPEQASPPQVQPSMIRSHGNTVYLKWTFPQGFQEDSLLFSNHDARLEGTFRNSQGPYGSISAQRLSSCEH